MLKEDIILIIFFICGISFEKYRRIQKMLKEDIILIIFFICGISFVIFMNIQRHYKAKLIILFRIKYPELHDKYILFDTGHYPLFITRPIRLMKYIWFEKDYPKEIVVLIKKIRLYQKLGLFLLLAGFFIPLLIELIFQYIIK